MLPFTNHLKMPRTHNVEDMSYEKNSLKQITWIVYETTWSSVPDADWDRQTNVKKKM